MSLPVSPRGLDLFSLLPAVYRLRDIQLAESLPLLTDGEKAIVAQLELLSAPSMPPLASEQQALLDELTAKASRGPLASLLLVLEEQIAILANDLDQLYDDQFIETCAPWVIPYIGDLIGYRAVAGIAPEIDDPRAEVANTIAFRRRKGTVLVMEELARDATAWGAHAVEFFRVLGDCQYMNHIRRHNFYAPDLRNWKSCLFVDTGFDRTAHRIDVRRIGSSFRRDPGRYNIQNIGIFLWSQGAWSVTHSGVTPSPSGANCFRFSSLGMDMPLFHNAVPPGFEPDDTNINDPARQFNVADRLPRRVLCDDLTKGVGARYYGEANSLVVYLNSSPLNPYEIQVCDLAGPEGAWANTPVNPLFKAAVDPELGRIALPAAAAGTPSPIVTTSYIYGFNADLGGGEYARAAGVNGQNAFLETDPASIVPFPDTSGLLGYTDLQGAINYAVGLLSNNGMVAVEIADSDIHTTAGPLTIHIPANTTFELRAAEGARPTILLDGAISVSAAGVASETGAIAINGLLVAASPTMAPAAPSALALLHAPEQNPDGTYNRLTQLSLIHSTFVPGWSVETSGEPLYPNQPVVLVEVAGLVVNAARSILGCVRMHRLASFNGSDSILDGTSPTGTAYAAPDFVPASLGAGALTLIGCTVIGKIHSVLFSLISDSILWSWLSPADNPLQWPASVIADRTQQGCVRFSYLPSGAITPRQFECVDKNPNNPQPLFFALRYGRPGYAKLLAKTSDRIRRGADDGGEMGVFHYLLAPQRETDLRIRIEEYMPVGMEFGLIFQN
ncbi:MAG TPA: hypothetical protein VGI45_33275 [Terracidiphilus sp.]|jgi:hypothetical protein